MSTAILNPTPTPKSEARSIPGRFGAYGGRYVPETLMAALEELEAAYAEAQADPALLGCPSDQPAGRGEDLPQT